jgi:hypothetical protein
MNFRESPLEIRGLVAAMNRMIAIKRATLNERHLRPGRTKHSIADSKRSQEFPPFVSLAICQYPGDSGYYLMHICEDGQVADTWHENVNDAFHQAEWEFGIQPAEWNETSEPF